MKSINDIHFPLINLTLDSWDFKEDSMLLLDPYLVKNFSPATDYYYGHQFVDAKGYIYKIVGVEKLNISWWKKIIPFSKKSMLVFERENLFMTNIEIRDFMLEKLRAIENPSDYCKKWIKVIEGTDDVLKMHFPEID